MWNPYNSERKLKQVLKLGDIHQERMSPADTMFANTGRRLYVTGDIDGRFRPRSNSYDLYAFGRPQADDPLAEKLQGVWAQPVKGFGGYVFSLEGLDFSWTLDSASQFTQSFSAVEFEFQRESLRVVRRDFVPMDLPVLFSRLTLENTGSQKLECRLTFHVDFDLEDAWFTLLGQSRNDGQTVDAAENLLLARANVLPEDWAAGVQCDRRPDELRALEHSAGEMHFHLSLAPGQPDSLTFAFGVLVQGGAAAVQQLLEQALPLSQALLEEKEAGYTHLLENAPRLVSPDLNFNAAFQLAAANLLMLEAENDTMGRYFYAGLDMFPFWFSNDGAYSVTGLLAAGLVNPALNHLRIGMPYQEQGRVPHQISPSGKTAFPGNAQETPLWVLGIWDAYRWTGNREFLDSLYPGVIKGIFEYTLRTIDPDGDGYASGPGMVEVEGMGEEKLDTCAYTWLALKALEQMAQVMRDAPAVDQARGWITKIEKNFDADWWDETSGTYAMSLEKDNRRYPVPHWAVVTPLEVGLATPDHAARTLKTLRKEYLNEWGLKHTAGNDERVWTLPTATLSRAAYRYGEIELGFEMLRDEIKTLQQGSIGMFHELIPEGACIIQLWSAATFIRGVVEDVLGIWVRSDRDEITVQPHLPEDWESARIENLTFGTQTLNVEVHRNGEINVARVR